jgi:hypothetical protein
MEGLGRPLGALAGPDEGGPPERDPHYGPPGYVRHSVRAKCLISLMMHFHIWINWLAHKNSPFCTRNELAAEAVPG